MLLMERNIFTRDACFLLEIKGFVNSYLFKIPNCWEGYGVCKSNKYQIKNLGGREDEVDGRRITT